MQYFAVLAPSLCLGKEYIHCGTGAKGRARKSFSEHLHPHALVATIQNLPFFHPVLWTREIGAGVTLVQMATNATILRS
jgi:hypothetical protein